MFGARLSVKEQIIFMKRLSMMLRAQMPIVTSLEMLASESSKGNIAQISKTIITDVSAGVTFSHALARHKKTFGFFVISLVAVGERSGTLPESLEYISSELKKKHELKTQIMGALIYPAIVIMATLAITLFLIVYIFPKIVPIFLSVKTTLPWSTRFLISVSDFLTSYGWYLLLTLILLAIAITFLSRFSKVAYLFTYTLLRLPILGKLFRFYNLAHFARTLSLLLSTHVPIMTGLEITATSTENVVYRKALKALLPEIATGKNLANALAKEPRLFPPLLIQMVEAGEKTGNLSTTLAYVSELYETDIRDLTKNLTTILEPVLMLVMGLLVGFIAISIITPIYGITQNLHQ
jgi:type II secretory pathway component PulF